MLHTPQSDRSRVMAASEFTLDQDNQGGLGDLVNFTLGFLRRQYVVILFTTALSLAGSLIYLRATPPTYTSYAKVLLGNPKAQFVQQQSILPDSPLDVAQLESQLQILKSKAIAASVIKQLKLDQDPDFTTPSKPLASASRSLTVETSPPFPSSAQVGAGQREGSLPACSPSPRPTATLPSAHNGSW